jgi:hypothetical protein
MNPPIAGISAEVLEGVDALGIQEAIVLLDRPGEAFNGGELLLVEQRPRKQSRPRVIPIVQGAIAVIPAKERPSQSVRGVSRIQVRHGVSEVRHGLRRSLGVIFHDAA